MCMSNLLLYGIYGEFCQIRPSHLALPYTKSLFEECWNIFNNELNYTMSTRFRTDISVFHFLMREWSFMKGNFSPLNVFKHNKYTDIASDDVKNICKYITGSKYKQLVINDGENCNLPKTEFENRLSKIINAFEKKFLEKSSFEK